MESCFEFSVDMSLLFQTSFEKTWSANETKTRTAISGHLYDLFSLRRAEIDRSPCDSTLMLG